MGVHTAHAAKYVEEAPSAVEECAQIHLLPMEDEVVWVRMQKHDLVTLNLVHVDVPI